MRRTLQERFEATEVGRALIGAFILVTLFSIITSNLPRSELRRTSSDVSQPYRRLTGLDQRWEVFAPNPRQYALGFEARIEYADGSVDTWRIPRGEPFLSRFRTYRWQKWMEHVTDPARGPAMWPATSAWLVREHAERSRKPVEITLVRRERELAFPGRGDEPPWRETVLYEAAIGSGGEL